MSIHSLRNQLRRLAASHTDGHRCPRCRCPFASGELERIRDAVLDKSVAELRPLDKTVAGLPRPDTPLSEAARKRIDKAYADARCPRCGEPIVGLLDFSVDPMVAALQRAENRCH